MALTIIPAYNKNNHFVEKENLLALDIAECFADTIQGEGASIGQAATFLRLQGCVLNCTWCDTTAVWKQGSRYSFEQIFSLLEQFAVIQKLKNGQHLVITGGSPLKQQYALIDFLTAFEKRFGFIAYIEIENEAVIPIAPNLIRFVSQWNHSPKLQHSGMRKSVCYDKSCIQQASKLNNAWFKFVIDTEADWEEIERDFLSPQLIRHDQIILMPMADTKENLEQRREQVVNLSIQHHVRFSDRLHITLYDKKTGI